MFSCAHIISTVPIVVHLAPRGQFKGDGSLTAFWISFPKDAIFPLGLGVTAWSPSDAFRLLEEQGYDFHLRAAEVAVREGVSIEDIDEGHVRANMGPTIVRGVWCPCANIGFGGPGRP